MQIWPSNIKCSSLPIFRKNALRLLISSLHSHQASRACHDAYSNCLRSNSRAVNWLVGCMTGVGGTEQCMKLT